MEGSFGALLEARSIEMFSAIDSSAHFVAIFFFSLGTSEPRLALCFVCFGATGPRVRFSGRSQREELVINLGGPSQCHKTCFFDALFCFFLLFFYHVPLGRCCAPVQFCLLLSAVFVHEAVKKWFSRGWLRSFHCNARTTLLLLVGVDKIEALARSQWV